MIQLTHLQKLEAESIHIFREVAAECEKPVLLYSIGKDSAVLLHLAMKAFYPSKPPFPLLHVDTTWKFREMIEFRDRRLQGSGPRAARPHQPGWRRGRREPVRLRFAPAHRRDEDAGAETGAGQVQVRRGLWRRAPRRGEIPRQGAHIFAALRPSIAGTPRTSAPNPGGSTTPASGRAKASASSRCPTGPRPTCGTISPRRTSRSFPSISPRSARWCAATAR